MLLAFRNTASATVPPLPRRASVSAKHLYFSLLTERGAAAGDIDASSATASRDFLLGKLDMAASLGTEFPDDLRALPAWLDHEHSQTTSAYRQYLDDRRAGAPRRYFATRAHALNFIRAVAPTKLVDGAWLYGLLPRWQDPRLAPLIRIYLEELGDGVAARHHVLIYRQLLARYGCDRWQDQPDAHFTQGAVQLALGHHADEFLPEVIGFNLGYEQLPLHLPITAYELNELDIDPYYFSLHVTIDNASTGHARKSLQCALDSLPRAGGEAEFARRVANGYRLNFVGMGTNDAVERFDLDRELLSVLADKARAGAQLHSDYCRVAGRTVADWLSSPDQLPRFLEVLQAAGWIERGKDPAASRFWRLLTDPQAPMFGVFDAYEQQLLRDWIVDGAGGSPPARPVNRFRQRPGTATSAADPTSAPGHAGTVAQVIERHLADAAAAAADAEIAELAEQLAGVRTQGVALDRLRGWLSPARHPTPAGLVATRLYADLVAR